MKKIILSLVMAAVAIVAGAQTTYNVRAGVGLTGESTIVPSVMAQCNIPFNKTSSWIVAPTINLAYNFDETHFELASVNVGRRFILGNGCVFAPKVGLGVGNGCPDYYYNDGFMYGLSADLAFEIRHFVVGLTSFVSFNKAEYWEGDDSKIGIVSLTLGYKF